MTDPRKCIADFYRTGDSRGPGGTLKLLGLEPEQGASTAWFAVYRPTSRDAIAKMLAGVAVGKGLNVKGKSAKKGMLSGLVPFIQISDNEHKALVEKSPGHERVRVFYKSEDEREVAFLSLQDILWQLEHKLGEDLDMENPDIDFVDDYILGEPSRDVYGLDIPEPLLHEAYIMKPDLRPMVGWETGRKSEPAFMDMNLHAIRGGLEPDIVLLQHDSNDPMNPRGLLIAYAEEYVKPVVSDLDTFTVGSMGMQYEPLIEDQLQLARWALDHTLEFVKTPNSEGWTTRWLNMLKCEIADGFHPDIPTYGFGDPTSYRLIENAVEATLSCGAVRHGAECFNFYFPQELDDNYLVVWQGFPDIPWVYKTEPELREFLMERAREGYSFPLNPVWPVRDKGWYEVMAALKCNETTVKTMEAWWVPDSEIRERSEEFHKQHPEGFIVVAGSDSIEQSDLTSAEKAEYLLEKATRSSTAPDRSSKKRGTGRWTQRGSGAATGGRCTQRGTRGGRISMEQSDRTSVINGEPVPEAVGASGKLRFSRIPSVVEEVDVEKVQPPTLGGPTAKRPARVTRVDTGKFS